VHSACVAAGQNCESRFCLLKHLFQHGVTTRCRVAEGFQNLYPACWRHGAEIMERVETSHTVELKALTDHIERFMPG